jgi:hypothetical protein
MHIQLASSLFIFLVMPPSEQQPVCYRKYANLVSFSTQGT